MVRVDGQEVFSIDQLYPERNAKEQIKGAMSRFAHLEKFRLIFSSSTFVIRVLKSSQFFSFIKFYVFSVFLST